MAIRVLRYLTSIQFFIVTLTLLGIVSVIGIVIPQGWEHHQYLQKFGKGFAYFVVRTGWDNIFASLWFIVPLTAFVLNLIHCVYNRIIFLIKILHWTPPDPAQFTEHGNAKTIKCSDTTIASVIDTLEQSLKKYRYHIKKRETAEAVSIIALKGRIGLAGSMALHAGLVVLIAGGIVQTYWGDCYNATLSKGKVVPIEKFDIQVRMHHFETVSNKKGELLNYATALEIMDNNGITLLSDTTKVNAPFKYRNLYFYQAHYGLEPYIIERFQTSIIDSVTKDTVYTGTVPFNRKVTLGSSELAVLCDTFLCDFVFDIRTRTPLNRSHEHNNPAFKVTLFRNDTLVHAQWIFLNFPASHGSHGRYNCVITAYDPSFYSGIEIRKKPGTPIIWLGIILVSIGILLVFMFPFRQFYLVCKEIAGTLSILCFPDKKRVPDWFDEETDKIASRMKEGG
jgi:cytochrome c biogenesis protein